ncbi:MAG: hypothetical protein KJZ69_07595 [Phycisphaerales bacterium]|nr:hypothetical protein [Phycisphaerales bacterium]
MYFWTNEGPPTDLWDTFVYNWGEDDQNGGLGRTPFPDFDRDLAEMESYGLLHACYGEFQQGIVPKEGNPLRPVPDEFDLTVVRANAVRPHEDWIADYTNLFTTIRGDLEEENTAYLIPSFTPHPNAPYDECDCVPRP